MTSPMQRANTWSQLVIGAAIEVHRIKGPGLIEEIYSKCLGRECELRNIPLVKEFRVVSEVQRSRIRATVTARYSYRRCADRRL